MVCVSEAIKEMQETTNMSFLVISHYARLYSLIKPTRVAVMINGRVVLEGGVEIIDKIDSQGYEWMKYELGIEVAKEDKNMNQVSIGTCATRDALGK